MRHRHFPIRTSSGLTQQQEWLLRRFLSRLDDGRLETSELLNALITIREARPSARLLDWCDTAAHVKREKGQTWKSGILIWREKLWVDEYFANDSLEIEKIPIGVFEALLQTIEHRGLGISTVDLKRLYPGGMTKEEVLCQLRFMYRRKEASGYYELHRPSVSDKSDLVLVRAILPILERRCYGLKPLHFDDIHQDFRHVFDRLLGSGARVLKKQKQLLALHFLCAFHQTEIGLAGTSLLNPCYLTVDSTASGHLALSLAVYEKDKSGLDQILLHRESRPARQLMASHGYARPYLVTDLTEVRHLDSSEKDERIWGTLFKSALRVQRTRLGYRLTRANPVHLPRLCVPGDNTFSSLS